MQQLDYEAKAREIEKSLGEVDFTITSLDLNRVGCFNLAGINNLVSLVRLSCNDNRLTSLDIGRKNKYG